MVTNGLLFYLDEDRLVHCSEQGINAIRRHKHSIHSMQKHGFLLVQNIHSITLTTLIGDNREGIS